ILAAPGPGATERLPGRDPDDAADALAALHRRERAVDLLERHRVRDQLVDLEPAIHVPVDVPWQLGAPARPAEGGAAPAAPGDEQEGSGVDLLAGARDADDDRLTPALVRARQRLAPDLHVA